MNFLKAQDFFDHMQSENASFRLVNSNMTGDATVLRGRFSKTIIRSGLTLHYSDMTNLCSLSTDTEAPPHLGIKLFFQGGVTARIGNRNIPMPHQRENTDRWIPSATLFNQKESELFRRRAAVGDRVRKLSIKISPEWLESGEVFNNGGANKLKLFTTQSLAALSWIPGSAFMALAGQLIDPPPFEPYLAKLYVESRVLAVISEAFKLLEDGGSRHHDVTNLSMAERRRLEHVEEVLNHIGELPSVEELAVDVGVSVNTLQRLFHVAHGTTVFNYVRTVKLERARKALQFDGLTITQAAYIAGYTSPANFSTAFKKHYRLSPKEARLHPYSSKI